MVDIYKKKKFLVHLNNGEIFKFRECSSGLYYYDTDSINNKDKTKETVINYTVLQTVANNKEYFTNTEIEGTDKSRDYQELIFSLGTSNFKGYIRNNLIQNCDICVDDVNRSDII